MNPILKIIKNRQLTHEQKVIQLSREAENSINVLKISPEIKYFMEKKIICDLSEGNAPYRPRYILPDYEKFMKEGSAFLKLNPPEDLEEAVNNLLILYKHTPSITNFPVFLGNLDILLEPFILDEIKDYKTIKRFLTHIDRTLTDSFVHANIGPTATKAGLLILKAERELVNAVPNLTLKYDNQTPNDFAIEAILTGLTCAKPYFANHNLFVNDFGTNYGIASCYNGLPTGGGSFTLARLNLKNLSKEAINIEDFVTNILPKGVDAMCELMDERIKFLVEESGFFESNFLVEENLISKDNFTAMFGIHGLAECVNNLTNAKKLKDKFGHKETSDNLGVQIIECLEKEVNKHKNIYCKISNQKFLLHAQCGIGTDEKTSPGCRIPVGEEPETVDQITQAAMFHKYFPTGISDIFTFEETAQKNPQFLLDIINGAMKSGLRIFSFYTKNSDLIRITGYLVKKSEMAKFKVGEKVLQDTVELGFYATESLNIDKRKIVKL